MPEGAFPQDMLLIRARVEQDILGMLDILELPRSRAHGTPDADYAWRALVTRVEWEYYLSVEIERLDYPNFKARVLEVTVLDEAKCNPSCASWARLGPQSSRPRLETRTRNRRSLWAA